MSAYSRFELLAASFTVGLLELVVALVIWRPNPYEALHVVMNHRGVDQEFALILGVLSCMLLYGSVRPKRNCRHLGLALSGLMMLTVFGVLLSSSWFSLSAGVLLVLALVAFGLYLADAHVHVRDRRSLTCERP